MAMSAAALLDGAKKTALLFLSFCLLCVAASMLTHTGTAESATSTQAEGTSSGLLKFEVATIKPVNPNVLKMVGVTVHRGGRVVIQAFPLKSLVAAAFNLSGWQISGGDAWTEKDEYTVEGKPPETSGSNEYSSRYTLSGIEDERLRQMLQTLLIERFQLKFHREMKTGTVYLMEGSGKGLRLHPTEAPSADPNPVGAMGSIGWAGKWVFYNTSMPQLAKFASDFVFHCPVSDHTGLQGSFDYRSPIQTDSETHFADQTGSFISLMDEIGLKLKKSKASCPIFVIDHAERPSPN
jgi:uncharacterized protein (TIGR03435 family)